MTVFRLIVNDGLQDRMLMATELLNARIREIMEIRAKEALEKQILLNKIKATQYKHIIIWRAITRRNKIKQAQNKVLYECVLDMLRMRIRDFNEGVRTSMI